MLAESPLIEHTEWKRYLFTLQPKKGTWDTFLIEAVCRGKPYNGNLLVGDCSTVQRQ